MCTSHTHGPNTVATAPHLISGSQYLQTPISRLPEINSQSILQSVLSLQPFTDAQRSAFNNITNKEGKIVFLADHISAYYTELASVAFANGDTRTGNALMEEMKKCITQIHNGVL